LPHRWSIDARNISTQCAGVDHATSTCSEHWHR
jgi:hypothetical protein